MTKEYFHQVMTLHEPPKLEWERIAQQAPRLPRGWYELSQLKRVDRIEFTREYWLSKFRRFMPDTAWLEMRIKKFFENLEDIGLFVTQDKEKCPCEVHMVYSLKGATGFLQGSPPANEGRIEMLKKGFDQFGLPADYLFFLQIHDGFSKYIDRGLIKTEEIARTYQRFQQRISHHETVIPFYESFGLHCYQCFYAYGKGNVCYDHYKEADQVFPTFLNWLLFYLEN